MRTQNPFPEAPAPGFARRLRRRLARLSHDCRATVAIEFAFVLPLLCMMTFGLYEVTQGVICYMKVVDVANTVADLIGQTSIAESGVADADLDNYYIAGQLVMTPSTGNNLGIAISSVWFGPTGTNAQECWHAVRGGAAAIGNATSFVSGLGTANGSAIVVKASYTYTSLLNYFITTPIVITSQVAQQPRNLLPNAYKEGIPYPPSLPAAQTCSG